MNFLHAPAALFAAALVVGLLATGPAPATAETASSERDAHARDLEALRREVAEERAREAALAEEIATLREDRAKLNERLIDVAAEVQSSETAITAAEDRLAELGDRRAGVRGSLAARRGLLAELLGALQRMGRQPPPALLVTPEDALQAVRSAILLGAVLPELRAETAALLADLTELKRLQEATDTEKATLRARADELETQRRELAALVEAKRQSIATNETELEATRTRAAELAEQAEGLEELVAALDREAPAGRPGAAEAPGGLSKEEARAALSDPARLAPAMPFAEAVGLLPMPVSGPVVKAFGQRDEYGDVAQGMSVATRSAAQVVSPADGHVVFAGPFRSYGQLLIVDAGDGYHVLLAGMRKVGVEVGQFVLAGEPVGIMGELRLASAAETSVGARQPVLYIEFRKDGRSIDPAPWWSDDGTGVGG